MTNWKGRKQRKHMYEILRIFKGVDINKAFPCVSSQGRVFKGGEGPHPPRALIKPFYLKALMLSMQIFTYH